MFKHKDFLALTNATLEQELRGIILDGEHWPCITRTTDSSRKYVIHGNKCKECIHSETQSRGRRLHVFHEKMVCHLTSLPRAEAAQMMHILRRRLPITVRTAYTYATTKSMAITTSTMEEWTRHYRPQFLHDKNLYPSLVGKAIMTAHESEQPLAIFTHCPAPDTAPPSQ